MDFYAIIVGGERGVHRKGERMDARVFGARVRALREARGWTQGQLAYKARTTAPQISRIENDERPGVQAVTIGRIAQALDTTVGYLLGQTGDPSRPPATSEEDADEVLLRTRADELIRRWRLVARYAPDQLETLINIAYTQASLVLGAASAEDAVEVENDEEVTAARE